MNLFQTIICNQYADLKKNNKDATKAKLNAVILSSVIIFLFIASAFILLMILMPSLVKIPHSWLLSGKFIGKIGGIVLIFILYFIINKFLITDVYFSKTIEKYELLDEQNKKSVYNKAFVYLFGAIGLFLVIVLFSLFI